MRGESVATAALSAAKSAESALLTQPTRWAASLGPAAKPFTTMGVWQPPPSTALTIAAATLTIATASGHLPSCRSRLVYVPVLQVQRRGGLRLCGLQRRTFGHLWLDVA